MGQGTERVIALIDMDCFYVQVEERDDPSIKGKPAAVVQYKTYKGGGIIAVNYEARAKGVTRSMRGDDAKAVCPEILLVRVPEQRGKADLTKYRDGGREVIQVLSEFSSCVERASIDEAYIDLTEAVDQRLGALASEIDIFLESQPKETIKALNMTHFETNYVLGYGSTEEWFKTIKSSEITPTDDIRLAVGAEIVGEMREAVFQKTGFRCSAGIGHNKIIAKLVCGINKPNKQTVIPHSSVPQLWLTTNVQKVRGLGGKLGDFLVEKMKCKLMSDLLPFSEKELISAVGSKTGSWIYNIARGFDEEPVNSRQLPKSIGCNKNFMGREALTTKDRVKFWINNLAAEVVERINRDHLMNNRRAKSLTLHVKFEDQTPLSRACGIHPQYNPERIAADAFAMMEKLYQNLGLLPVTMLGLIASKFEEEADTSGYAKINSFFVEKASSSKQVASTSDRRILKPNANASSSATSTSTGVTCSEPKTSETSSNISRIVSSTILAESTSTSTSSSSSTSSSKAALETNSSLTLSTEKTKNKDAEATTETEPAPVRKPMFVYSYTAPAKDSRSPRKGVNNGPNSVPKLTLGTQQQCERCAKSVRLMDYIAHMDHHFARDLSREINGLPALGFDLRPETLEKRERERERAEAERSPRKKVGGSKRPLGGTSSTSTSKRGRPAKAGTSAKPKVPVKTIDSYFQKQT